MAVLGSLGAPVCSSDDVPEALRQRRLAYWRRYCEPVTVCWEGKPAEITLRLPRHEINGRIQCELLQEDGEILRWQEELASLRPKRAVTVEGQVYETLGMSLGFNLVPGYHRLRIHLLSKTIETQLIAAPALAYDPLPGEEDHLWGVFLPLYALYSRQSWGSGDFSDLNRVLEWLRHLGGNLVGTLPLLSCFLEQPFDPSPYTPVSRLFWNEFYLDVTRLPEFLADPQSQKLYGSPGFQEELASLRKMSLVDYRRGMALKRAALECCVRHCFERSPKRLEQLNHWADSSPMIYDYARFRAVTERQGRGWPVWPDRLRSGRFHPGDYDLEAERYHLYVQWQAQEQLQQLSVQARQNGQRLYLDLPLGVNGAGFDVWRFPDIFSPGSSAGAPPDDFFTAGQNWGLPPLHPEGIRYQGYRYYRDCLHQLMQHAGILRLDHVMGLHRLFWIPQGFSAKDGVYVRYHSKEFYAVLTLESQRHRSLVVGEDLGTVPEGVRETMTARHIHRMHVLPFEYYGYPDRSRRDIPYYSLACLGTHDMLPYASWFEQEKATGNPMVLLDFLHDQGWLEAPTQAMQPVLRASLSHLAASPARILLINLEDLWQETAPQNIPGTIDEYPNWRRKTRYGLEEIVEQAFVQETLQQVNHLRKGAT